MKISKKAAIWITTIVLLACVNVSLGFSECRNSGVTDPSVPGVFNCLSWVAYLKSQGQSLGEWCGVSANYQKCCFTCQNLGKQEDCTDVADATDCAVKAAQGLCTADSTAGITVRIYCQKTCNICPATFGDGSISCNSLSVGCNGGTCKSATFFNQPSISCTCPSGFSGDYCERANPCSNNPCLNGGACQALNDIDTPYTCTCPSGYSGVNCGNGCTTTGGCSSFTCYNGGRCQLNSNNQPECVCLYGFAGPNCQTLPCQNGCANNPCVNGGTCVTSANGGYTCTCPAGYSGLNCQLNGIGTGGAACSNNQCRNAATCYETSATTYGCACPGGYYGTYCENSYTGPVNGNSCANSPCLNGGTCQTVDSSNFICLCPTGTSGLYCQNTGSGGGNSRPCTNNQCKNGATCYETSATQYGCACVSGFYGTYCDNAQQFNGPCQNSPCLNGGTCQPIGLTDYICKCPTGTSGLTCQTTSGSNSCAQNLCLNGATCYSTSATDYSCICQSNFHGTYCENTRQLCQTNSCKNGGTCRDIGNSDFICICPTGVIGLYCDGGIGYSELTAENNTLTVKGREITDLCSQNECKNDGTCFEINETEYGCACTGGFYGKFCETSLLVVATLPTTRVNQSTTKAIVLSTMNDPCEANLCQNGGTCQNMGFSDYICICRSDFEGKICESSKRSVTQTVQINLCDSNSCLNGGVCSAKEDGSISCACAPGYFGNRCDVTNVCFSNPCLNGGACLLSSSGYNCTCTSMFSGKNCENASCSSEPCQNGGICLVTGNKPYCSCLPGFTGKNCEFASSCATMTCKNGGTCVQKDTLVQCKCSKDFYGQYCENQITEEICRIGDRHKVDCKIWEFYGFCSYSYTYNAVPVPIYCPNTCNLCTDSSICKDSQTNCGIWLNMGLCKNINELDPNACKQSCGYCKNF